MTSPATMVVRKVNVINAASDYRTTSPIDPVMCDHGSATRISSINVGECAGFVCSFMRRRVPRS